jgi:hypothetical protein
MAGVTWIEVRRRAAIITAVLALGLSVLIPSGVMVAANGGGLVVCTGHGPMTIAAELGAATKGGSPRDTGSKDHGLCPFTGHGAAPTLSTPSVPAVVATPWMAVAAPTCRTVSLGRPLAAPPPPSHAPPTVSDLI